MPDYPHVRPLLEAAYDHFKVLEWSAEPAFVGRLKNDADITVSFLVDRVSDLDGFMAWLRKSGIPGLMIEGELV